MIKDSISHQIELTNMYLLLSVWCVIFKVGLTDKNKFHIETKTEGDTFNLVCQLEVAKFQELKITNRLNESVSVIAGIHSEPSQRSCDMYTQLRTEYRYNFFCDAENATLRVKLDNVSNEDHKTIFMCRAPQKTISTLLKVNDGPGQSLKFDVNTTDIVIIEGMEMNVTCMASCTPECNVWWTRDQNVTISQNVLFVHDVLTYVPDPPKKMYLNQHTTTIDLTEVGKFEYGLISGGVVLLVTLPVILGLYCHHKRYKKKRLDEIKEGADGDDEKFLRIFFIKETQICIDKDETI
ncbi:hypothetical protein KUTeg_001769 [Tegillarca granosa]|uniref:Ig-like domain-containing protein n=1 Tax=Tegillarca granosa TaxID=220873 RepID=A0ABQ9FSE7_TEGGR|nr:hypothetical protein KUTeg_001769 [Tegillarca granosa]